MAEVHASRDASRKAFLEVIRGAAIATHAAASFVAAARLRPIDEKLLLHASLVSAWEQVLCKPT